MSQNESTITGGLGLEEGFFGEALELVAKNWKSQETVSDVLLEAAMDVRNAVLGEMEEVKLTSYEKKLVLVGYIAGLQRAHMESLHEKLSSLGGIEGLLGGLLGGKDSED